MRSPLTPRVQHCCRMSDVVVATFAAAIAIALLPTLLLLGRAGGRRLRRGEEAESSVGDQGAAASRSQSASATALSTPSGAASSAAVKGVLRAARESDAGRRLRVSLAMGLTGWAILVISVTPAAMALPTKRRTSWSRPPLDISFGGSWRSRRASASSSSPSSQPMHARSASCAPLSYSSTRCSARSSSPTQSPKTADRCRRW